MANSELACVYAALILHDDGVEITVRARPPRYRAARATQDGWMPCGARLAIARWNATMPTHTLHAMAACEASRGAVHPLSTPAPSPPRPLRPVPPPHVLGTISHDFSPPC